jgi:hypothetical protein
MHRRLWIDVADGEEVFFFVDNVGWDLASGDFLEYSHGSSSSI